MKPGWKTTEFWLSLAALLVGAVMSSGALESAPDGLVKVIGMVSVLLTALGYTVQRGFVKGTSAKADAVVAASEASVPPKP